MIVKLKTLKQLEEEFKPLCRKWYMDVGGDLRIYYEDNIWLINSVMINKLGKTIDVVMDERGSYTHTNGQWSWHEMWFQKEEFLTEKDFEI